MALDLSPEQPVEPSHHVGRRPASAGADMHHALEFGVVVAGCMRRHHGAGWFRVGVGQAWATGSLEIHQWRRLRNCQYVSFVLLPHVLGQLPIVAGFDATAPFRSPARLKAIGRDRLFRRSLSALAREIAPRAGEAQTPGQVLVDMLRLLQPVCAEVLRHTGRLALPADGPPRASVEPAIELVQHDTGRLVRVDEAAHVCHMARRTFCRAFTSAMGMGFGEFALRWRLACAAGVLKSTDAPLKAVADRFGFHSASHFHQAFRARYGVSPTCYRRTPGG